MTMSMDRFPVGLEMDVSYPDFQVSLTLLSVTQLRFEIKEGPFARAEIVDIHSHAALPGGQFLRMTGTLAVTRPADRVFDDRPQRNKALDQETGCRRTRSKRISSSSIPTTVRGVATVAQPDQYAEGVSRVVIT